VRQNELKAALEQQIVIETASSGDLAVGSKNNFMHLETGSAVPDGSSPTALLVDLDRLRDVTDNEPVRMRRLVDIYLSQTASMLDELGAAIQSNSSEDIARLAHKLVGSSISCGVQAFTHPLRELEQLGRGGDLSRSSALLEEVRHKFPGVRSAFDKFLSSIPSPAAMIV
jgi:HPt (histidine-containing phosphotransfer) domain-containing protein